MNIFVFKQKTKNNKFIIYTVHTKHTVKVLNINLVFLQKLLNILELDIKTEMIIL